MTNLESESAEAIWTVDREETIFSGGKIYDTPIDFLWSPHLEREFVYLADGAALGGAWRVDAEARQANHLTSAGSRLLAWTPEGIVIQNRGVIRLLGETGEVRGEIRFSEDEIVGSLDTITNAVVNWEVPYVHQLYDVPDDGFDGEWACGPTSAVMALAYYKLVPHPIDVPNPDPHESQFGWYVTTEYTHRSACEGEHTFSDTQPDRFGHHAAGAYGACMSGGGADPELIRTYVRNHDVGSYRDNTPTLDEVKKELDGGAVVLLSTYLMPNGHVVIVRGYTQDDNLIVNDPYGYKPGGSYDKEHLDQPVEYSWSHMSPHRYVALYGPEYLPDVYKSYYSSDGSTITIHNGAQGAGWNADIDVCLMNSSGYLNRIVENTSIPPNGSWNLSLYDVFGWYGSFSGSAVVMPNQTAVSVVVVNTASSKAYAYNGLSAGVAANPGWGQVGTDVHLPLVMNGHSSWYSHMAIQNVGSSQTTVYVDFEPGSTYAYDVAAGGVLLLDNLGFLGSPYLGSARVTADEPLAAMASHWKDSGSTHVAYAHNAFTSGTNTNHLPLVFRRYSPTSTSGWCTGVDVRNLGGSGTNVTLTYRPTNLGGTYSASQWVSGNGKTTFWLPGLSGFPDGSYSVATVSASQPLVSVANTTKYAADVALSYNGFLNTDGTATVIVPLVYRGYNGWDTGVQTHNVGSQGTNVTISYYDTNGTFQCSNGPYWVDSQKGYNFYQPTSCLPDNFVGSAVVTASGGDARIVAQVNAMNYGASYASSYNGFNR